MHFPHIHASNLKWKVNSKLQKSLKIPKWLAETVNRRRTDNTMARSKRTQGQTM